MRIGNLILRGLFRKTNLIIFILIYIFCINSPVNALKPFVAMSGAKADSARMIGLASLLEKQILNVFNSTGIFNIINPDLLKDQLTRYGCLEENCIIGFARSAGIDLIIRASVEDKGDSVRISLYGQGINSPYYGSIVYQYSAIIPLKGLAISGMEYNYIFEEHAGYFISGLLRVYKTQIFLNIEKDGNRVFDSEQVLNGDYEIFRYEKDPGPDAYIRKSKKLGSVAIDNNRVISVSPGSLILENNDFVYVTYNKKAEFLNNFFYGRKHELIYDNSPTKDTMVFLFSTVPISVMMPLIAPLGYYRNGDFSGLSLWAVSTFPYLYLEYNGLKNRPETYKKEKQDIPRSSQVRYKFGMYMLLCGGIPLVIDAFSAHLHYLAQSYQGRQPYMGNNITAVYLSLISGGGGHFYKGYRLQGYLFFHLHNILLYSVFREFSASERYDNTSGSYIKESRDKKRAYFYLSSFGLLKMIEIAHVLLIRDNIRNGKITEREFGFEPAVLMDDNGVSIGMQYTVKF